MISRYGVPPPESKLGFSLTSADRAAHTFQSSADTDRRRHKNLPEHLNTIADGIGVSDYPITTQLIGTITPTPNRGLTGTIS
jgi:hypothetical protein